MGRALRLLVRRQHGVVSRRQLLAGGLTRRQIQLRIQRGVLIRVHHGVYAVGHLALTQEARLVAAVLACGEGSVISHRSAGALWRICDPPRKIELIQTRRGKAASQGLTVHRIGTVREHEHLVSGEVPVTTVARTLLDLASLGSTDLIDSALEAADRRGLLRHGQMKRLLAEGGRRRGVALLRDRYRPRDPGQRPTRSEFERLVLRDLLNAGAPAPQHNVIVNGREVDLFWPEHRLMVELDGAASHRGDGAFNSDRDRDLSMSVAGYRVIRISWAMYRSDPGRVIAGIKSVLASLEPVRRQRSSAA